MRGAWYNHGEGYLMARVTASGNHYIQSGTKVGERTLRYKPREDDYFQMALRIDDCVLADPSQPLAVGLSFAGAVNTDFVYNEKLQQNFPASVIDNGFFIATVPMAGLWNGETELQGLRLYIRNLAPKTGTEGKVTVDFVYFGPKSNLPNQLFTVTFLNHDGTVLATQQVPEGGTATYTGTSPTKPYDSTNHYVFAGWDKELTNITADITVKAKYTTTAHSLTYTNVDQTNHKTNCSCGYSATIPHEWRNGSITTAPTCAATGLKTYICGTCKATKTETVAALGHSYVYTGINTLLHSITCKNCDYSAESSHNYTDGTCICGESEIKEPVEDPSLKLNHSLNLASDISLTLAVPKALLAGFDLTTVFVESTIDIYEGNVKTGSTTVRIEPIENEYYYLFPLKGLTAVQMGDRIISVLYDTKDGQIYCSPTDSYSISDYAYSQMNKAGIDHSLKILCADLLRYGSTAQIFKNYRTDALCDTAMTEVHRSYLSNTEELTFGNTNQTLSDLETPTISWVGKSLNLESKVAVKYIINTANYTGSLSELSLRISYVDLYGKKQTVIITDLEVYDEANHRYAFSFNGLLAAELRCVLSAQVYKEHTPLSCTLNYSPDTYGNNKSGALGDLCTALMAYSDSARAYFMQ